MKIISLGEILWDVFPSGEHLGGAPFNFAAHAHRLGHEVFFVSAVGVDPRGRAALVKMQELGLATRFVECLPGRSTGIVSVSVNPEGQPCFTIHRPAAYDFVWLGADEITGISSPPADWIYFGTLHQYGGHLGSRAPALLQELMGANPRARRFYDVNLRRDSYDAPLIRSLMKRASVVKLNDAEVETLSEMLGEPHPSIEGFCRRQARAHGWEAVCVTRGAAGCGLLIGEDYVEVEGYPVQVADTVGAGDAFAAAFLHGLDSIRRGWRPAEVGDFANRVGALISSRPGAIPAWSVEEARALSRDAPSPA